jgi:hypothetical protein
MLKLLMSVFMSLACAADINDELSNCYNMHYPDYDMVKCCQNQEYYRYLLNQCYEERG